MVRGVYRHRVLYRSIEYVSGEKARLKNGFSRAIYYRTSDAAVARMRNVKRRVLPERNVCNRGSIRNVECFHSGRRRLLPGNWI